MILILMRRIDMAIAHLERLLYHLRARLAAQSVRPQPKQRDLQMPAHIHVHNYIIHV